MGNTVCRIFHARCRADILVTFSLVVHTLSTFHLRIQARDSDQNRSPEMAPTIILARAHRSRSHQKVDRPSTASGSYIRSMIQGKSRIRSGPSEFKMIQRCDRLRLAVTYNNGWNASYKRTTAENKKTEAGCEI